MSDLSLKSLFSFIFEIFLILFDFTIHQTAFLFFQSLHLENPNINLRRQLRGVQSSHLLCLLHPGTPFVLLLEPSLCSHTHRGTYTRQRADIHTHTYSVSHRQPQTRLCPQQPPHLDSHQTQAQMDMSPPPLRLAEAEGHSCSILINSRTVKISVSPALHQIV